MGILRALGISGWASLYQFFYVFVGLDHPVLGMPVFGWLPPRHALTPQRRVIIGRKQHGNLAAPGYGTGPGRGLENGIGDYLVSITNVRGCK